MNCLSIYFVLICHGIAMKKNNLNEFESILNEISAVCITNNVEHLCLLGDISTDFLRTQSWYTQAPKRFIDHENFYISLYHERSMSLILIQIIIVKHFPHLTTHYCPKVSLTI